MSDYIYISDVIPKKQNKEYFTSNTPLKAEVKKAIISHMKNGNDYSYCFSYACDRVTQEQMSFTNDIKTDGKYCWSKELEYHFIKYDIPLKQDFIDYVLSCNS